LAGTSGREINLDTKEAGDITDGMNVIILFCPVSIFLMTQVILTGHESTNRVPNAKKLLSLSMLLC